MVPVGFGRVAAARVAAGVHLLGPVSGGHHDEQRLLALKADLLIEEVGVLLGLAEQGGDHAEVDGRADQGNLDGNPAFFAAAVSAFSVFWAEAESAG